MRLITLSLVFLVSSVAYSATYTSVASGDWTNTATWDLAGAPGSSDDVIISNGDSVNIDADTSCNTLTMFGSSILHLSNELDVAGLFDMRSTASSELCKVTINDTLKVLRLRGRAGHASFTTRLQGSSMLLTDFTKSGGYLLFSSADRSSASSSHILSVAARANSLLIQRANGVNTVFLEDSLRLENALRFAGGGSTTNIMDMDDAGAVVAWSGTITGGAKILNSASGGRFHIADASNIVSSANVIYNDVTITDNTSSSLSNSFTLLGDLTIQAGGELNSNGNSVTISGSMRVDGVYSSSTSETITFNSSSATQETISGTGTLAFARMIVNTNLAGGIEVTSTDTLDIKVGLEIDQGTLSTNDTKVRLYSDANNTAYLGEIGIPNGALDGELILRKYITGLTGDANWYYLHVPIPGANISVVQEGNSPIGIYTYGYAGSNSPTTVTYTSSYTYDQSALTTDFDEGWIADGAGSTFSHTNGKIFRMGGSSGVGAKSTYILEAGGSIIDGGAAQISGAHTVTTGTFAEEGWHLAANPYPCAITFNLANQASNIQANELYVYTPKAVGTWETIDNGSVIPAWQSFFYQAQSGTTATIDFEEEDKLESSSTAWLKAAKSGDALSFRICADSIGKCEFLKTEFKDDADLGFDGWDAFGLRNPWPRPNAFIVVEDSLLFRKNRVPTGTPELEFPIEIDVEYAGSYTISLDDLPNFSTCQSIEDLVTGQIMTLDENFSYTFTQTDLSPTRRFVVSMSNPVTSMDVESASCFDSANGEVELDVASSFGTYGLVIEDESGASIFAAFDTVGQLTISNLSAGIYKVLLENEDFSCSIDEQFEIFEPSEIMVDYEASSLQANIHPSASESISFTNKSIGASEFAWNFGDGSPVSTDANPSHLYTEAGTYQVELSAGNGNSDCDQSYTSLVQAVNNAPAGSVELEEVKPYNLLVSKDIRIEFESEVNRVDVLNALGQVVYSNEKVDGDLLIDLKKNGIYLINIEMNGKSFVEKVALSN